MERKAYHTPAIEKITQSRIENITPLLMSGPPPTPPTPTYAYVYVVNSPQFGYGVLGHSAILFESSSGLVNLYSFHPYNNSSARATGSIARIVNDLHRESFSNFKSACFTPTTETDDNGETLPPGIPVFNGYKTWNEPFRRAMKLKVPYRKYLNMLSYAGDKAVSPPEYIAAIYNCQSFVTEVLAAGGVVLGHQLGSGNVFPYTSELVPNVVFDGTSLEGTTGVYSLEKITF